MVMPGASGLDVLRALVATDENTQIILLTAGIKQDELMAALKIGAPGIVLKEAAAYDLVEAIGAVQSGQHWLGPRPVADLVTALQQFGPDQQMPTCWRFTARRRQPPGQFRTA
jgi:DNA-binding NarL/FixJ family response regulator